MCRRKRGPWANKNLRGKGHRNALSRESASSLKARQRLICAEVVSPGKNEFCLKEKFFDEQGQKEFKVHPGLGRTGISLWKMTELEQAFKPFESELDLPATTVDPEGRDRTRLLRSGW